MRETVNRLIAEDNLPSGAQLVDIKEDTFLTHVKKSGIRVEFILNGKDYFMNIPVDKKRFTNYRNKIIDGCFK